MKTTRWAALLGIAVFLGALFLVGQDRAWWSADEVDRLEEERAAYGLRTEAGERATVTLQGTGVPAPAEPTTSACEPERLSAQQGTLSFHFQQGWSFVKQAVVPVAEADLVFESCAGGISSVRLVTPRGGIANAGRAGIERWRFGTARALYEALVRGHPEKLNLEASATGDDRDSATDVFLARTKRGEWLKMAIVERATRGGWTTRPVTIAFALEPEAPVFLPGSGDHVRAGFEFDLLLAASQDQAFVAERERVLAERERPARERLAALDGRATRLQEVARAHGHRDHHVAAVLARRHAQDLGSRNAYRDATYSFEHHTRDDVETTRNDWEIALSNWNRALWLSVRTVTDDRGKIADLGDLSFEDALRGEFPVGKGAERIPAVAGHLYLLHTLDRETDHWILFRILELTDGEDVVFEWVKVANPDPLRHAFGGEEKDLWSGYARLQLRSDHGGGNPHRAFLDGSKNAYVDRLADTLLNLNSSEARKGESSAAYVEGGLVPLGMVFLVESVDIRIDIDGDDEPRVDSLVRVGPYPVLWIEDLRGWEGEGEARWHLFTADGGFERVDREGLHLRRRFAVRIPIRRDDEKTVFVEGATFTRNDVVLSGCLLPAAEAPESASSPPSLHNWRHHLQRLVLTEDTERAVQSLRREDGLASWLRGLRSMATESAYRTRLDLGIEHLETMAK